MLYRYIVAVICLVPSVGRDGYNIDLITGVELLDHVVFSAGA